MEQNKREMNNLLQSMSNPMQNLLGVMHNMVGNMGVREYSEVLSLLHDADEKIRTALDLANNITYGIKK